MCQMTTMVYGEKTNCQGYKKLPSTQRDIKISNPKGKFFVWNFAVAQRLNMHSNII